MLPEGLHAWWWPSHCHELWRTKGRMYMNVVRKSRQLRKIFWEIQMRFDKHVVISRPSHSVLSEIHGFWNLWKRTRKIVESLWTSPWQHCFSLHSSCPALRRCVRSGLISNGWSHGKGSQLGAQMSEFGNTWSMPIGQAIVMRPSDFLQKCESWNMLKNSAPATWSGGPEMSTVQSHQILHLRRKATLPRHQILCTSWQTQSKVATKSLTQNSTQNEWHFHYSARTIPDGSQTIPFSPHPAVPQTLLSPLWAHVLPGTTYLLAFCVSTIF